jgi:hypothetical protein
MREESSMNDRAERVELFYKYVAPPKKANFKGAPQSAYFTDLLGCDFLDDVYDKASHQKWRVKVTVTALSAPAGVPSVGYDDEAAWFPGGTVFAGECISSLLTQDGKLNPSSKVVGWVQVHRDALIWLGWGPNNEITIEWKNTFCLADSLYGTDDDGNRWRIDFDIWYAGFAPTWPTWLKP